MPDVPIPDQPSDPSAFPVIPRRRCRVLPREPRNVIGREKDLAALKDRLIRIPAKGKKAAYFWSRPDEIERLWRLSGKTQEELAAEINRKQIEAIQRKFLRAKDPRRLRKCHRDFLEDLACVLDVPFDQIVDHAYDPTSPSGPAFVVMHGWPGVGKSTLTAVLAHDDRDVPRAFPDGVLWTALGPDPDIDFFPLLREWCLSVARDLVGEPLEAITNLDQAKNYLRDRLKGRRVLLIVDDAWSADHVWPFDVGGHGCALLVTTRRGDVARDVADKADDVFTLDVLDSEKALELLETLAPKVVKEDRDHCAELVAELGGLPLAIQVAGRLLQRSSGRPGAQVQEMLRKLYSGAAILAERPPANMAPLVRQTTPTVATLLKLSTDLLSPEDRERFSMLGVQACKPAHFGRKLLARIWKGGNADLIAETLRDAGLIQAIEGDRFEMHALLVALAKSLLTEES